MARYVCHASAEPGGRYVAAMVSDPDYPPKIIYRLLHQLLTEFEKTYSKLGEYKARPPWLRFVPSLYSDRNSNPHPVGKADQKLPFPALQEFMDKYQDPASADKVFAIQKEP